MERGVEVGLTQDSKVSSNICLGVLNSHSAREQDFPLNPPLDGVLITKWDFCSAVFSAFNLMMHRKLERNLFPTVESE